jgi:hypothetical protein
MPDLEKKTKFVLFSEIPDLVSEMPDLEKTFMLFRVLMRERSCVRKK